MIRTSALLLAVLAFLCPGPQDKPSIDGRIDEHEWAGAKRAKLSGGGEVLILPRGEFVFVAVRGLKPGLASLCVAKGKSVRILHASAAIGDATFERWGDVWMKRRGFEWTLRDSPRTGGPSETAKIEALSKSGWLANASAAGSPDREFQIVATDIESLGVTFLSTDNPMTVSYWPATMSDDCRTVKIPQGYLPDTARFDPSSWTLLARK
jgi:hypothetical protein